jgi:DNA-binding response OmpR family regulator/DNA-binding CsgD family transcriptional regulator
MKARDIVLVVDDSPETLRLLTDALEEAGATVLVSLDGNNALALVERVTPDVILMDAMMPGMDGFETCRRLKRNKNLAHVPVIFMTGLSETEHIVKGLEAGGVDYVTKPIVPDELIARIHVHLANARYAQSARVALDAAGRFLIAANRDGRVLWCTPQASTLLSRVLSPSDSDHLVLPAGTQSWIQDCSRGEAGAKADSRLLERDGADLPLQLTYLGQIGSNEFLLRLNEGDPGGVGLLLKQRLAVTLREAEVLLWITRGKSNRDIGEILGLSPRTVNKHLEHIYTKLGVENRSSAAAVALRALESR